MSLIPIAGPWITAKEVEYVADAAASGWYANSGTYVQRFERAFASRLNVRHAVSLPSCTAGIHLSLAALGVGPGDEVIVPDLTWIASAAPITYVGATPVFADVDPASWCLSVESFESWITPKTKAVIPVDLYGNIPDMGALRSSAERHGIAVIEDAAEAVGSSFEGRMAGSFGDTGVFSFHGSKTLTTGEGGMLVTDRDDLYQRVAVLRDHGRKPGDKLFLNEEIGFKYKMSSMQAALGLAQLERLDELVARKREIFGWYKGHLDGVPRIMLNSEGPGVTNSYWMVTVVIDPDRGKEKVGLIRRLAECGVDSRPIFTPLSALPAFAKSPFKDAARERNPVSYRIGPYGVNLPSGFNLTEELVERVCVALRKCLDSPRA
jgi:perosamine synthetase